MLLSFIQLPAPMTSWMLGSIANPAHMQMCFGPTTVLNAKFVTGAAIANVVWSPCWYHPAQLAATAPLCHHKVHNPPCSFMKRTLSS